MFPNISGEKERRHFVIVDPYSSGFYLVQEFRQQGVPLIGVQSSKNLADFWLQQYDESLFVRTIRHESMEKTLGILKEYNVVGCIPGCEPGVYLSEDIQEGLQLPNRNGAETKNWRRHKYHQTERLHECGIRGIRQTFAANAEECLAWQKQWNKWPIIVKPAESGGTDGVFWCHNAEDCRTAFDTECHKMNVNGVVNNKLLCQEFLDGPEYVIDAVSYEGQHVVSGMWVYEKIHNSETKAISYCYARFIESTGEIQEKIIRYIFEVLTVLGIKYGPTHSEVIITPDGEPCLVESGARMHGLKGPKMTELATGMGTHELVVDVYAHEGRIFKDLVKRDYRYVVKKYAFETMFNNSMKKGTLKRDLNVEVLKKCDSCIDAVGLIKKGQNLIITRDLGSAPGYMLNVHSSLEKCFADIQFLRDLESSGEFYPTEEDGTASGSTDVEEQDIESSDLSFLSRKMSFDMSPCSPLCASPRRRGCGSPSSLSAQLEVIEFKLEGLDD